MLATDPRISHLAGMVKYYAPLKTNYGVEMVRLLSTTDEFDALPEWLQEHLLKVERMFQEDEQTLAKHLAGKHDQSTHAGQRLSVETPSFSDVESAAISIYSGSAALQINANLRGQSRRGQIASVFDLKQNQIDTAVKNLDSAIDKSVLAEKVTMEREIPFASVKGGMFSSIAGKTISDKGYLSLKRGTSNIPPRRGYVKLKIVAPAGTKALDLSFINPNAMGEIVFPRDTKIRITDYFANSQTVRGEIVE